MKTEERDRRGALISLIAKYSTTGSVSDLKAAVASLLELAPESSQQIVHDFVGLAHAAAEFNHFPELVSTGLLSRLSLSTDSEVLRVAAFAYWRLGDTQRASDLQDASLKYVNRVDSTASLELRVGSAILRYRSIGTPVSRAAASESFKQVVVESDEFRNLAGDFVLALDDHDDLGSDEAETVFRKVLAAPTDQDTCRLAAFVFWRRKDEVSAAEWQQRSLVAPRLLWTLDQVHYLASRRNEHPGRFRR